jgi:hypothetical protein
MKGVSGWVERIVWLYRMTTEVGVESDERLMAVHNNVSTKLGMMWTGTRT